MQVILRLAAMEVKNESTCEISFFWKLFNKILSKITERDYTFHPNAIMVDENGANYCTIRQVVGLHFATSKVVSCQMHYKNDINKVFFRIGVSYKDNFESMSYEICTIATVSQYNEWKQWLDEITNLLPNISWWVEW